MNKTLSIALAGFSFIIDEHAYIKLSDYLNALRNSLDAAEADEVMHDIEIRMVEIFKETLGKREVVNDSDVEKVIEQIGSPEKIEEQEEAYYSESKKANSNNKQQHSYNSQKQLFRDPENQKIAGVCAGLASYFGMDITKMRLIWIGAFLLLWIAPGSSFIVILAYIILWAILPKAESASDFLKMKGKPLNFDNLKEESSKIVQFANEATSKAGNLINENRPKIQSFGDTLISIIKYCFAIFIGLVAIGSFIGLFAIIFAYGSDQFGMDNDLSFYLEENNLGYLMLAIAGLPVFIIGVGSLLLSIKLISPKTKFNYIGRVLGSLALIWIILIGILAVNASSLDLNLSGTNEDDENISITTTNDTIYLDTKKVNIPESFKAYNNKKYSDKKTVFKRDYPYVEITRKEGLKTPYLIIKKEAKGYNKPLKMKVPVEIVGNKILFPNYFEYPYEFRFRRYHLEYELVVPTTTKVINEKDFEITLKENNDDDSNHNSGISINEGENKIQIGKTTITYDSHNSDSVTINGKKYSKDSAEIVFEKLKIKDDIFKNLEDLKKLDINIKDGEKEIIIKTK